jgi:ABC-type bacteriocin/lantibiotic exporter with double-glycine peptidase domain
VYDEKPTDTIILIEHFKTYQQTSDYSCGCASVLMVLNYYGITQVTEDQLYTELNTATAANPRPDGTYGTSATAIRDYFLDHGFDVISGNTNGTKYFTEIEAFQDFLKAQLSLNRPMIVENVVWGGHWMVLIGYDDMGTEELEDDVVIMADPYDTTDHSQDGYTVISFYQFYEQWFDSHILPPGEKWQSFTLPIKK